MADPTPSQSPGQAPGQPSSQSSGQSPDFQLRPVQSPPAGTPNGPPAASASGTAGTVAPGGAAGTGDAASVGMSPTELVLAVAVTLVLALLLLLVRGAVRGHLIGERASLSAASNAGWALWAFLLSVTATAVFGIIGGLFDSLAFTAPMALLVLATLFLAVATWRGALRRRR